MAFNRNIFKKDKMTFLLNRTGQVGSMRRIYKEEEEVGNMKLQFYEHLQRCFCIFSAFASEICILCYSFGFDPFLKWRGKNSKGAWILSVKF